MRLGTIDTPRDTPHPSRDVLKLPEAAQRLGLAPETLRRYRHRPPYAVLRVDNGTRAVLFSGQRIQAFLDAYAGRPALARQRR